MIDNDLSLQCHVNHITRTCFYHLRQLRVICRLLTVDTAHSLVRALVHSRLDYCTGVATLPGRCHLRSAAYGDLFVPATYTKTIGSRGFSCAGPVARNSLQPVLKDPSLSFTTFKKLLKTGLVRRQTAASCIFYWQANKLHIYHQESIQMKAWYSHIVGNAKKNCFSGRYRHCTCKLRYKMMWKICSFYSSCESNKRCLSMPIIITENVVHSVEFLNLSSGSFSKWPLTNNVQNRH